MWVIYNAETGIELDRVEHYADAKELRDGANRDSISGDRYNMRWEE